MNVTTHPDPRQINLAVTQEELALLLNSMNHLLQLMSPKDDQSPSQAWYDAELSAAVGSRQKIAALLAETIRQKEALAQPRVKEARVYFIGAGPGAPDLITVRGAQLLATCDLVLYAGSLVPAKLLDYAPDNVEKHDTATLSLPEQIELYQQAKQAGLQVARVHSGDPAIYGATAEQMQALQALEIAYEVVPGVSSFTACAAALGAELTRPNVTQTIILTRTSGRASPVPDSENLASLAAHRASLCVFLGGNQLPGNVAELLRHYPPQTPAALVQRASQPEERRHVATLGTLLDGLKLSEWALTTMLLVSPALGSVEQLQSLSRLYDPEYAHRFRRAAKNSDTASSQDVDG